LRRSFAQTADLPFANVLSSDRLAQALQDEQPEWREEHFTPAITLAAFLSQVHDPDPSCRQAVARIRAWQVAQGQPPCSPNTGGYCKARRRLALGLLTRLTRETGRELHHQAPEGWRWKGRRVKLADGTTVTLADTPDNQKAYPQPDTQKPGLGFPLARVVVVFCLACGVVVDAALGKYQGKQTGETALLRGLEAAFQPGDVLLADRYYGGWFDLAWWQQRGVDVVVRLHAGRHSDFRRGRRLGPGDHVVRWPKPARPAWLDEATYAALPAFLEVREVRVTVKRPGFRTKTLVVVTTLLDAEAYPAADLGELYRWRWDAELHLRSLKGTLGMGQLRCKTAAMAERELWAHLLAYNLLRTVVAQAAQVQELTPREVSFTGAKQTVRAFTERLAEATAERRGELVRELLVGVAAHRVGNRPDRSEPRARKRRPKAYPLLMVPRREAQRRLRKAG
jgi:hypothetical protein